MNRHLQTSRSAFTHQPAQYLIVDLGHPMNQTIVENCTAALQTVLSLACSIRGGTRIPGFALSVIGTQYQCICRLDTIRGNFSKLKNALDSLSEMVPIAEERIEFKDVLFDAFKMALDDFKSKSDNLGVNNVWQLSSQLQITLLTTKPGMEIQEYLEQIVQTLLTTRLKKIMVVELSSVSNLSATYSNQDAQLELPKTLGFVELLKITHHQNIIEDFFKQWLRDYNPDHEHMRIIFPNGAMETQNTHSFHNLYNHNFVLKCDISECIINPLSLPFGHKFSIQTDFFGFQLGGTMFGKQQGNDLPIYELVVVARLSSGGICESLLFGQPVCLSPTQCWRLEWSKLLNNQKSFIALCRELSLKDEFLLTQLKPQLQSDQVSSYFIIVPGEGNLLLKAVASSELALPNKHIKLDQGTSVDDIPDEVDSQLIRSLNILPHLSEYNPQFWKSDICSALIRNLMNNTRTHQIQDKDNLEMTKTNLKNPNSIVKHALQKASFRGKGQKRTRRASNKGVNSPEENTK